jgi:hypothetical protein
MIRAAPISAAFSTMKSVRLLDRGEHEPEVGRITLWGCLLGHLQHAATFARLDHLGAPFAVPPVKEEHRIAHALPHHPKEVMRLRLVQRNGLPFP